MYQTRETVRQISLQPEIKTDLKICGRGIGVQTPVEYRDARKSLQPLIKDAEYHGKTTRVTGNKLHINRSLTKTIHKRQAL